MMNGSGELGTGPMPSISSCTLLITGGRVLDPETGRDELGWVAIDGDTITAVGAQAEPAPHADRTIDATGLVVAPGFIDMHSHAQSINGARLQALDGVTTALELEGGALPVDAHHEWAAEHGRAINYGYAAAWAATRMVVLDDAPIRTPQQDPRFRIALNMFEHHQDGARWRAAADAGEEARIVDRMREQIEHGAIGVGLLQGYVPGSRPEELDALAALAAEVDQPLFVHARSIAPRSPGSALDAVTELITAAERRGAPVHLCHMNSTSLTMADQIADALLAAQDRGVRITTEAYPYPAGSTVIGAVFLSPEQLERNGMVPSDLTYLPLQERVADADRLRELREIDPGGLCITANYDLENAADLALLMRCLTFPGGAVASDAMPMTYIGRRAPGPNDGTAPEDEALARRALTEDVWPLPPGLLAHPRSSGCFAMALSWLSRDLAVLSLTEVVRRCTLVPASILASAVPALARKGRLQPGMDADLTIFDPEEVAPGGDFERLAPSRGFVHVLVGGTPVVTDGVLDPQARPGVGLRGSAAA